MSDQTPVQVALPDGRQFSAPSIETVVAWARDGRVPGDAVIVEAGRGPIVAARHPALAGLVPPGSAVAPSGGDETVAAIIPYRNAPALIGYYVSVGSLIPFVGLFAGPAAIALGVAGWKKVRREPRCRGTAHAIVAVVLGSLTTLANWGVVVLIFGAALSG